MKKTKTAKILLLDIETSPIIAHVWSLWQQDVSLNQIVQDWHILSFSAKWLDSDEIIYFDQRDEKDISNDKKLLKKVWKLLDEADVVVGQNSKAFDIKKLNARFIINGMQPPSSYLQIDTKELAKKHFAFTSNKLEYMTDKLCHTHKKTKSKKFHGHVLWVECMKGNKAAWKEMEAYNKMDVLSLEELYLKLRPWGGSGVNFSVFNEEGPEACECGSESFVKNGFYYTTAGKFQKYRCTECGLEHREKINMLKKDKRKNMRQTTKR
jgi:hypothetical protein